MYLENNYQARTAEGGRSLSSLRTQYPDSRGVFHLVSPSLLSRPEPQLPLCEAGRRRMI